MRLLLIGDIVGRPGKHACSQIVPRLIRERDLDGVIANAENTTGGSGLTPAMFNKLLHYGVDVCTMGDHIYKRLEITASLNNSDRIVKPANLPAEAAGKPFTVVPLRSGARIAVVSLLGRTYMNLKSDCPFHTIDRVLEELPDDVTVRIVDMHAETTGEKVAMGWYLDGRISAMFGTHTHIQTADERVLPEGTAYISDLGMTGPYDSVLGRNKHAVIRNLRTSMPFPFDVASDDVRLCGAIVEIDAETGRATSIERVCERETSPTPPVSSEDRG